MFNRTKSRHSKKVYVRAAVAVLAALAVIFGFSAYAAPQASACCSSVIVEPAIEVLNQTGEDGRQLTVTIDYDRSIGNVTSGGQTGRAVYINAIAYRTYPNFQANRVDISVETTPGNYTIVYHRGGDKDTWDDVAEDWNTGAQGWAHPISYSDTPKWRLRVWGICAGACQNYYAEYGNIY